MNYDPTRRCDILRMTPAERAIAEAIDEVKKLGADPKMMNILINLAILGSQVADFVDGVGTWQNVVVKMQGHGTD